MGSVTRKIASVGLSLTTAIWLSGAAAILPVAQAATVEELQTQIAQLLAQITTMQAQLATQSGGTVATSCSFTRDLTVGSKGDDVKCLQQTLNANGYKVAESGVGSPGNETSFFGPATKKALSKWQESKSIMPSAGYFGPKTRSTLSGMVVAPNPGMTSPTPVGVVVPTSGVSITLASDTPSGSAIAGAGQIDTMKINVTAGTAAGTTITGLTFNKDGVVSDTMISNLYLADENGTIVAQYSSLSGGVATFAGLNIQVNAGATRALTLRTDLSSGAAAGNTLAWKLATATTSNNVAVSGLPVMGKVLTVTTVSNPSIATATFTFNAVGSTVDAGTNNVLVASVTANVNNSAVNLKNIKFSVVGSANMADIRNVRLKVNGEQVGSTLSSVSSDGTAVFSISSGKSLRTGNSTVEVYADIAGSPNRTAKFTILRPYDIHVVDSQYTTGISPTVSSTAATEITFNQGQITVSLASDTPTGNIPNGASNVTLAKFTVYASGEPVKVKFIDAKITSNSGSDWDGSTLANYTEDLQNIKLIDDAGNQVGSTISTITSGTGNGACTLASLTLTCHFGSTSSNINYTVPANTTRVLSLVTDVLSGNDTTSLQGSLNQGSSNLEGQISFQTASSGASDGSTLTVSTSPLTVARNTSFNNPTYAAGALGKRLASFVLTASSAEGAKVSTITLDKDSNASIDLQNLKIKIGDTQFGTTKPTIGTVETGMAFSASAPVVVAAGGSVTVDVYADILASSATGTHASVIDFTNWSALGATSNSSISISPSGGVTGQDVTISAGATLTLAAESTPATKQVVMSSSNNSLFKIRMTADNVEDIKITDITFTDTITNGTSGVASFNGLSLYDSATNSATKIAGPLNLTMSGAATSTVAFNLATPLVVLKNDQKVIELKGNVATFDSGGATSNSRHVFSIAATGNVTALGKDSNTSASVSGTPSSNSSTVYRTKLTVAATAITPTSGRTRTAIDDIATIKWTADSAYRAIVGTVTVKFQGSAVTDGVANFNVDLIDSDTGSSWGSASTQACNSGVGNSCSITFVPQFTLSAGTTKEVKLRVNSSDFNNNANSADSVSAIINSASDIAWNDGTTAGIPLEPTVTPFSIATVSYE